MCELCNGTHVIHKSNSYSVTIETCKTCGPKPKEKREAERRILLQRLADAKAKFGMSATA